MISIALIDDHTLLRHGYISMLKEYNNLDIVFETESPLAFLLSLRTSKQVPNILILDIEIPEMSGLELLEIVKSEFPELKVIVVSMHIREALVSGVIKEVRIVFFRKHPLELTSTRPLKMSWITDFTLMI